MDENQQQNRSKHFKNTTNARHQRYSLNSIDKNSATNDSGLYKYSWDDVRKIFVGGLNEETTEKHLCEHFGQFGEIEYINMKLEASTGLCRGFAFIVYKTMQGIDNALACTKHIINGMIIEPKKAIPRRVKLFVGGLSLEITDDDIKDYFNCFASIVKAEIPYDNVTNQRKGFCFVTFDNMQAVTKILRFQRHVIKGKQVHVKVAALKKKDSFHRMMPNGSEPMIDVQENVMDQGGFEPQSGYIPYTPGYFYGGYGYYIPYTVYNPQYSYGYAYPSYVAGVGADYQYGDNRASESCEFNENETTK